MYTVLNFKKDLFTNKNINVIPETVISFLCIKFKTVRKFCKRRFVTDV